VVGIASGAGLAGEGFGGDRAVGIALGQGEEFLEERAGFLRTGGLLAGALGGRLATDRDLAGGGGNLRGCIVERNGHAAERAVDAAVVLTSAGGPGRLDKNPSVPGPGYKGGRGAPRAAVGRCKKVRCGDAQVRPNLDPLFGGALSEVTIGKRLIPIIGIGMDKPLNSISARN
jgi:hypothetical protein